MKKKISLENVVEKERLPQEVIDLIERDGLLDFFDYNKISDVERALPESYQVAELELLGVKYAVIMKDTLASALLDPQAGDANDLKESGKIVRDRLINAYGKKQLKPLESNIEKTIFKTYLSSLLMNLVKYPTNKPDEETLNELGLFDKDISKLYVNAAAAWLGTDEGSDVIKGVSGIVSKLERIGYTGKDEKVDLSVETCHAGSHYVLKPQLRKQQINVQIQIPKINENYLEIEDRIVAHIQRDSTKEIIKQNARNLVRVYLNTALFYDRNKPLPLEWK